MTSVRYYSRWLREAGRGHVTAGLTWGSFFVYAVITILELGADYEDHFSGIGNSSLLYLCMGLGSAAAAYGFFYLLQPVKLDFYYSLPVKKSMIFWCRYLHGLFHFFLPLVLSVMCCVVYQCMRDTKFQAYAASYAVRSIVTALAVFLIFYHIVIFTFTAGGRIFSVLFLFGIINVFGRTVLQGICKAYAEQLFASYYCIPVFDRLETALSPRALSGLLLGEDIFMKQEVLEYVPDNMYMFAAFLWILLFFILSAYLQKKRKQEYVGNAFLSLAVEKSAVFLTSVCLALNFGGFILKIFYEKGEGRSRAVLLLVGSGVVFVILLHCLMQRLIRRAGEGIVGNRRQLLAEGALVLFISSGFAAAVPHFDGFSPGKDDVASIGICMNGLHMTQEEAVSNQYGKRDYTIDEKLETYRLKEEGLAKALVWLHSLKEQKDIGVKEKYTFVTVCYHMKEGGDRYRVYPVSETELLAFSSVYESREYKEKAYEVLKWEKVKDNRLLWSDGIISKVLKLSGDEKEEFIQLYKKEILALKMERLRESPPSGIVEMRSEKWGEQTELLIYPFLTDTCKFLSRHGVKVRADLFDYPVRSFKVYSEDTAAQGALSFPAVKIYESEELKDLKGKFVWTRLDVQPLLHPFEYSKKAEAEVEEPGSGALVKVKYFALFQDNNYDMMKNNAAFRK